MAGSAGLWRVTEVVVDVIKGRINVTQAADRLLARAPKAERYGS
ncbi:hypothetical protein [Streptomyces violascens]